MVNEDFNWSTINRGHSGPVHSMLYWLKPMCPCTLSLSQLTSMKVFAVTAFLVVVWFVLNLLYYSPVMSLLWFPACIPHTSCFIASGKGPFLLAAACTRIKVLCAVISAEFLLKFLGVLDAVSHPEPAACVNPSIVLNSASHVLSTLLDCLRGHQPVRPSVKRLDLRPAASIDTFSDLKP